MIPTILQYPALVKYIYQLAWWRHLAWWRQLALCAAWFSCIFLLQFVANGV